MVLFGGGLVLAAVQPSWLTAPVGAAVADAGPWAPAVFVALTVALTPFHLNGVLVVLSPVVWSLPVAAGLSYAGSLLGCGLTWLLLRRAGAHSLDQPTGWLGRLAGQVGRRPYLVGFVARFLLNSGIALEAFYVLTGYTRRQYLTVTALGVAAWIAQTFLGVAVLAAALSTSPWIGVVAVLLPLASLVVLVRHQRRRARATSEASASGPSLQP
jgi:hypothetical protein